MGFIVAFICVLVLVKLLRNLLIKHSASLLGFAADDIRGLWYISVVAGILLMIMFLCKMLFMRMAMATIVLVFFGIA